MCRLIQASKVNDLFKNIKAVGFDLDGTLYEYIPEISERIISISSNIILELKPELGSIENAREFFINESKTKESRYRAMAAAGHPNPKLAMREVIENAKIEELVNEDKKVAELVKRISEARYTYLVTTSPSTVGSKVLKKIGIDGAWFRVVVYGDNELINGEPKVNAMKVIIEESGIPADQHVYIGDRQSSDIVEPKSIGMKAIAVGSRIPEADVSVESVYSIEEILL